MNTLNMSRNKMDTMYMHPNTNIRLGCFKYLLRKYVQHTAISVLTEIFEKKPMKFDVGVQNYVIIDLIQSYLSNR